jgi:membrane protein DedA with SNARE-associated domain
LQRHFTCHVERNRAQGRSHPSAGATIEHRNVLDSNSLLGIHGLLFIFGNVFANQIGLPIPAFPTLVIAGSLCHGTLAVAAIFAVALIACVIADGAWFMAGRAYGDRALKMLCRMSLQPDSCLEGARLRFARRNASFLFVARFIPGVDQISVPLAGSLGIPWGPFLIFNTAGAVVWLAAGLTIGVCFKSQAHALLTLVTDAGAVITVIACLTVAYIAFRWWRRRSGGK